MKVHTNKKRIIISSIVLIILFLLIVLNFNCYKTESGFNYINYILSILSAITACVIFSIKIENLTTIFKKFFFKMHIIFVVNKNIKVIIAMKFSYN